MNAIKDSDFNKMKSFYFKSYSCHGAYHDTNTNIFDEIQAKLKRCQGEAPKCFVSLLKPEYIMILGYNCDKNQNVIGMRRTPVKEDIDIIDNGVHEYVRKDVYKFDLDEIERNKDEYFDYYYVTPNGVYKVDHELVHNRVNLIEEGKFSQEWREHVKKKCFGRYDFKEYYDCKKKQEQEKNRQLNSLRNAAPKKFRDFY